MNNIPSFVTMFFPEEFDNFVFTTLQCMLSHIRLSAMCKDAP